MLSTSVYGQEASKLQKKSSPSSLPQGVFALQWVLKAGYQPGQFSSDDRIYFGSNVIPVILVGASDRAEVSLWDPGIALRIGERGSSEWLPFISTGVASLGYSSLEGFLLNLKPFLGLQVRHWLSSDIAFYSHLSMATELALRSRRFCDSETAYNCDHFNYFEEVNLEFSLGLFIENNGWTFAPALTLEPQWQAKRGWRAPIVHMFQNQYQALRSVPLVQYQFTQAFAFGASPYGGFRTDLSDWVIGGSASVLFTW